MKNSKEAKMAAFTIKARPIVAPSPLNNAVVPSSAMLLVAQCQQLRYGDVVAGVACIGHVCSDACYATLPP